ncbi:A disintegrin and metalloproteinase with thrombospondin motifs 16 [Tupaia chinensis]|uniref:A disintegrin and metalloproteinase with thrombospondin motifs 16 n=1 Tax=Tupaia chinensis TaxID=246437 RepID=UPI0003C917FE|nr:A disintegrin and metalloproteinase with thrombospondin motifs 16 [Tupaia chinensis]
MPNTALLQGDANQNHSSIPPYSCQDSEYQSLKTTHVVWNADQPDPSDAVGGNEYCAFAEENSMEVPQEIQYYRAILLLEKCKAGKVRQNWLMNIRSSSEAGAHCGPTGGQLPTSPAAQHLHLRTGQRRVTDSAWSSATPRQTERVTVLPGPPSLPALWEPQSIDVRSYSDAPASHRGVAAVFLQAPACALGPAPAAPGSPSVPQPPAPAEQPDWADTGEYDLVTAYEVDDRGDYVSHEVLHHQRRRRAATAPGADSLYLRLKGVRHDFHMDLKTSRDLVAPGFLVQTWGKRGTKSVRAFPPQDLCFYQGSVRAHRNSSVALSTCQGLSGLIRTEEADYFLQPLPSHLAGKLPGSAGSGLPSHVLYKRSVSSRAPEASEVVLVSRKPEPANGHLLGGGLHPGLSQKQHFCGRRKKYMPQPPSEDLFILPDEYQSCLRHKRALLKYHGNEELNVETLVVVDKKMMQNHGHENITTYVLTILNMVSALFKDGTIGGNINIAIVGLILLEEEQPGLVISHHADRTLSSFCQWQSGLVGKDGTRHDHAILLTGLDICSWKNEPCDTLGFAPISGMCSKHRSCTVNEDTGLGLAFTIAHESGHNFGMVHDGEGNMCKKSEGNIMSPTLAGRNGVFSWSPCSRQYLHKFLSTAQAICLADQPKPVKEYKYPEKLPGELYDANTQCKWQFGEKAKLCMLDFKKDICKALWCHRIGRKCETKFMPAAEGTVCGRDLWCRGGQCVRYGDEGPQPTHGHWSDWSSWSPCSRTCGGGVSHRDRLCTNPRPSHGGKFCEGSTRTFNLCNSQKCPQDSVDFRAAQCAEFNSKQFRGWHYKWKPYTQVEDQDLCKLYCIAEGFDFFFSLSNKVKDGTPCSEDSRNVCIDGICERVGCDNILGSDAAEDACGVCKGNNSACVTHKGLYTKLHQTNQYYHMVTIPSGARSIRIYETNTSTSYISVRNALKRYYLNGHWTVDWPGRYKFSGTAFVYRRSYKEPESLTSAGPTNETLIVELLFQGRNPGVAWEYSMPRLGTKKKPIAQPSYAWAIVRSECSVSCGGGQMTTREGCYRDLRFPVNASFCNPKTRPATGLVSCRVSACPPSWSVGNWSICSRTCGGGTQSRPVQCTRRAHYSSEPVATSLCPQPVPASRQACNTQSCPPLWSVGPWAECSRTCGKGWRKRVVTCKSTSPSARAQLLPDAVCSSETKPRTHEACLPKRCHKHKKLQWLVSAWSQCSATCDRGTQRRVLKCAEKYISGKYRELASKKCLHLPKPTLELDRACTLLPCPKRPLYAAAGPRKASWFSSPWSQCSASCGGGVQTRSVQCLAGGQPASGCLVHQKPAASLACNTHFCAVAEKKDTFCQDHFAWCYLVPQHGMCSHKFYGKQCCRTCSQSSL